MSDLVDVRCHGFAWRERGNGELVVFLHGLGGSRISWDPQLDAIGTTRRAAAWDLPGYGDAAPLADHPVTFRALATAAHRWIAELGAARAHVVGISMGGMIAQYLAAWHPTIVRSLTLLSSSPAFGLDGTQPQVWQAARLAPLDQGLEPADLPFALRVGLRVHTSEPIASVVVLSNRPFVSFAISARTRSSRPGMPGVSQRRRKRSMSIGMAGFSVCARMGFCGDELRCRARSLREARMV